MTGPSKRLVQQSIAMIVIAAMLQRIGLSPVLILFFFVAGFLIWVVVARSNRKDGREVFDFYRAADEILRDEERDWYRFEIAEVVHSGEELFGWMPDAPPLVYFSLGALHHRAGDYESAVEHLAALLETDLAEARHRSSPSPALRQYVQMLRQIEREPALAPLALAAVHSLERGRRARAAVLLAESRERAHRIFDGADSVGLDCAVAAVGSKDESLEANNAPRPISEVLHEVYQDEETA